MVLAKRTGVDSLLNGFLVFLAHTLVETIRNTRVMAGPTALFCVIAQLLLDEFYINNNSSMGQLLSIPLPAKTLAKSLSCISASELTK